MDNKKSKDMFIYIRISLDEKRLIQKKANDFGLTVSEYMRDLALGYDVKDGN